MAEPKQAVTTSHESGTHPRTAGTSSASRHAAFERSAVALGVVALHGQFLNANAPLCKLLGYQRDELLARSLRSITHPWDVALELVELASVIDGTHPSHEAQKRLVRRDGEILRVIQRVDLVRDENGQPQHLVLQVAPASPDARADQALEREPDTEAQCAERLAALEVLASRSVTDIGNPLTYVMGNSDWVLRSVRELSQRCRSDKPPPPTQTAMQLDRLADALVRVSEGADRIRVALGELRDYLRNAPG